MLDKDNSLVLIVDFQERLVDATGAQGALCVASKLVKAASIMEIPIVVSEQYPKGLGRILKPIKDLLPKDTKIIEKTSFSLLGENGALEIIKQYGREQIILAGIETHVCVCQTAIDLLENGFEVYLVKDGSKSRNDFEHEAGIDLMRIEGVKISCLEIVLFELLKDAKSPHFKEVQALVK